MSINWDIFWKICIAIVSLIIGKYLDRIFKLKPKLISYYGHVSAFKLRSQNNLEVYTHSVVVINNGNDTATNVKVGHNFLPNDYVIFPVRSYSINQLGNNADEIVFDKLLPKEQVTISYLYFPPITYDKINSYVRSDEDFAKVIQVIPSPMPNKYLLIFAKFLMLLGAGSLIYLLFVTLS